MAMESTQLLDSTRLRREIRARGFSGVMEFVDEADLIDTLHQAAPEAALVLFGSRARGTAKRYSDYDIGVYQIDALEFAVFSRLLDLVSAWNEESLVIAQLVDLSHAHVSFLSSLADDLVLLAGSHTAWCDLLKKTRTQLRE